MFLFARPHRRANAIDRIATWVITTGGIAIIGAVILILVLIVQVALPLLRTPTVESVATVNLSDLLGDEAVVALCAGEYMETVGVLTAIGQFHFLNIADNEELAVQPVGAPSDVDATIREVSQFGNLEFSLWWSNNEVTLIQVQFRPEFDRIGTRTIVPLVKELATFPAPENALSTHAFARRGSDGELVRIDQVGPGSLLVSQQIVEEDLFGNETVTAATTKIEADKTILSTLTLSNNGVDLYAGTEDGRLLQWTLDDGGEATLVNDVDYNDTGKPITALGLVFGDISLAIVDESGDYSTWFPVTNSDSGVRSLRRIHTLRQADSGTRAIHQSRRNKMLLRLTESGSIYLDYPTNERHLLHFSANTPLSYVGFNTRANGILGLSAEGILYAWNLDCPHPEISLGTLFGPIWYEDYPEPGYTWQSSASTDDFEPKFSLIPLIFGSFKGTVYAMFFAVPLALLGAIYTSQFTNRRMQGAIKSTLEVMAAVPSVVIGFLIALWLAPIVETSVLSFICALAIFPACYASFVIACQPLRETALFKRVEKGNEFLVMIPVTLIAAVVAYVAGHGLESLIFSGDFKAWLYQEQGTRYDQRNCIIIAFGLGFAVIPIIFTIAEDAISNVPGSLKAASQALGASRWQTVWRVIVPTASPGIFAGIIIGFGRAVGETMIVLMATGNTPIMDWSIFNGMRTLSANIAVEIPEAPLGGTLYRVLFLSAVLLLLLTSVLNTVAELIRQHLRNKYGLSQ